MMRNKMINKRNKKKQQRGFTIIEVMLSMVIFAIAITGLVGMQKSAGSGAYKAKQLTVANNIGRVVLSQIKNEIGGWNSDISRTNFIAATKFPWIAPLQSSSEVWLPVTGQFDEFLGQSGLGSNSDYRFCVNYRLERMGQLASGGLPTIDDTDVWKIRVRVAWTRAGQYGADWSSCAVADVSARIAASGSDDVLELVGLATREFAR